MIIKGFQDTIHWYDQNAKEYAQTSLTRVALDEINEFTLLLPKHAKILDAGCGSGRDTNLLNQAGMNAIGLDLSNELIEIASKTFPDTIFIKGNMLNLPFANNSFDGIWAHASLLHFETVEDVTTALKQFSRVLRNNGTIHILIKAQVGDTKTAIVSDSLSHHNRFFQYFTLKEIKSLVHSTGFHIIKTEQYNDTKKFSNGRPEVNWILILAKKA